MGPPGFEPESMAPKATRITKLPYGPIMNELMRMNNGHARSEPSGLPSLRAQTCWGVFGAVLRISGMNYRFTPLRPLILYWEATSYITSLLNITGLYIAYSITSRQKIPGKKSSGKVLPTPIEYIPYISEEPPLSGSFRMRVCQWNRYIERR